MRIKTATKFASMLAYKSKRTWKTVECVKSGVPQMKLQQDPLLSVRIVVAALLRSFDPAETPGTFSVARTALSQRIIQM